MDAAAGHCPPAKYPAYFVVFRHHAIREKYGYTIYEHKRFRH